MKNPQVSFEQVANLAQHLSTLEKLRLIEHLTPDIEKALQPAAPLRRRSLRGILKGCSISAEDIDEARQEMWGNFPREAC
jgi:hypothetical protein